MGSTHTQYVELHCHSYFSLLDGASSPEALVARACALGYPALALTDHDGLYGAVRFWQAAREQGIKPIFGGEVCLDDGGHLTLLAETQAGYANLCRLISAGQLAGEKGHPLLAFETLAAHAGGLLCLSGCRQGTVARALLDEDARGAQRARRAAGQLSEVFPGRFWIELQRHYLPSDAHLVASSVALARALGAQCAGIVATNDVHYALRAARGVPGGQRLHDLLTSIRHLVTLPEALAGGLLYPNSERHLKAPREMEALFHDLPEELRTAVSETQEDIGLSDEVESLEQAGAEVASQQESLTEEMRSLEQETRQAVQDITDSIGGILRGEADAEEASDDD